MVSRCTWARTDLDIVYHDTEWGVPVHDDRTLFEFLILEGAQAGLSWTTILKKRENYRRAFDNFDPVLVARYGNHEIQRLLADSGIVRNRLKIFAAVQNAKAFLAVQEEFGSFDRYIWRFTDGAPKKNNWSSIESLPAHTRESDAMSRDLLRRGFRFVGPTICYAFMQAVGIVNDHLVDCFRYGEIGQVSVADRSLSRIVDPHSRVQACQRETDGVGSGETGLAGQFPHYQHLIIPLTEHQRESSR